MTRLTRSQVQDRNRETALEVARAAFLRDGYVANSVASVAKEAGFTTGIVYSSFGSKADLALAVLERLQAEQIDALGERVAGGLTSDKVLDQVRQWATEAWHRDGRDSSSSCCSTRCTIHASLRRRPSDRRHRSSRR